MKNNDDKDDDAEEKKEKTSSRHVSLVPAKEESSAARGKEARLSLSLFSRGGAVTSISEALFSLSLFSNARLSKPKEGGRMQRVRNKEREREKVARPLGSR